MYVQPSRIEISVISILELKVAQFSTKLAEKVAKAVFTLNVTVLQKAQNVSKYLGYTYVIKFVTKSFQKSPNLVTLIEIFQP